MIRLVAGHDRGVEIIVFIEVEITDRGLEVRVAPGQPGLPGYDEHLVARWGDPSPQFPDYPANANWTVIPFPEKEEIQGEKDDLMG